MVEQVGGRAKGSYNKRIKGAGRRHRHHRRPKRAKCKCGESYAKTYSSLSLFRVLQPAGMTRNDTNKEADYVNGNDDGAHGEDKIVNGYSVKKKEYYVAIKENEWDTLCVEVF